MKRKAGGCFPMVEDPIPRASGVPGLAPQLAQQLISYSDYQPLLGAIFTQEAVRLPNLQNGGGGNLDHALFLLCCPMPHHPLRKHLWGPRSIPRHLALFSVPQLTFHGGRISHRLELYHVGGAGTAGIHESLPPLHWDYNCMPPRQAFAF